MVSADKQAMSESASQLAGRVQNEGGGVGAHRQMSLEPKRPSCRPGLAPGPTDKDSSTQFPDRLRVTLLMRRPFPGQFSVERVFRDIADALPRDIEASLVELPCLSVGVIPRLRNMLFAARIQADVVHITGDIQYCALAVRPRRCVLTVLDLVSLRRLTGWRRHVLSVLWYRLPARRASAITTISTATRDELVAHVPSASEKVAVIPCPVGEKFRPGPAETSDTESFRVLQVGTGPNKNLERVAAALDGLPVHLHIIGRLRDEQQRVLRNQALPMSHDADLSDAEVQAAYRRSNLLVFASTYEGFGLPILEAQASGVPVVTSDIPPMCDTAGKAAVLVNPYDTASIRQGVKAVMEDDQLRRTLIEAGTVNVARYSSSEIAAKYANLYRTLTGN